MIPSIAPPPPIRGRVPAFEVEVNGTPVERAVAWQIEEVTVEDHVELPGMFTMELGAREGYAGGSPKRGGGSARGAGPSWIDDPTLFAIGDAVAIRMGYAGARLVSVIAGEIAALEPQFMASGLPRMTVRGYDRRHRLQRGRKTRTFVQMKDSEIAALLAREAGLAPEVDDSGVTHEYVIQANQTDLEFLQERARRINFEILLADERLLVRAVANDAAPSLRLSLADDLSEFRARLTSAGQVTQSVVRGWSAQQKEVIEAHADAVTAMAGRATGPALVKRAFGAAEESIVAQPVASLAEADALAQARLEATALHLIRGDGVCPGRPELRAGMVVELQGLGDRFSGPYYVVTASHRYGPDGYSTHFSVRRNAT